MAVRMNTARVRRQPEPVAAERYTATMGRPSCVSQGCDCRLSYVPRGKRQTARGAVPVSPYFRRFPGANHTRHCRFNTPAIVQRLVAKSVPFDGAEGIFNEERGGSLEYRLHILTEALEVLRSLRERPPEQHEQAFQGRQYVRGSRLLLPYIRRAKAIAALAMRIEDRAELARAIHIIHDRHRLEWHEFMFLPGEYEALFRRMRAGFNHPIAVVVTASRVFDPSFGKVDHMVSCRFEEISVRDEAVRAQPRIKTLDKRLADRIDINGESLICGIPQWENKIIKGQRYSYIDIDVGSFNQICKYNETD